MLQRLRLAASKLRAENRQMDSHLRIHMRQFQKFFAHRDLDAKLLPAFPRERLPLRLARLNLSARELPQEAMRLLLRPLA